jgi:hypothetical protein
MYANLKRNLYGRITGLGDDSSEDTTDLAPVPIGTFVGPTVAQAGGTMVDCSTFANKVLHPQTCWMTSTPTYVPPDTSTPSIPSVSAPTIPEADAAGRSTGAGVPAAAGMPECDSYSWWQQLWDPTMKNCMVNPKIVAAAKAKDAVISNVVTAVSYTVPILLVGGVLLVIVILPKMLEQGRR